MIRQRVITVFLLVFFIIVPSCKGRDKAEITVKVKELCKEDVTDVSIVQLISNPEKFDGKYVRLIGFVRLEFEGDAIYLHEDDYKYGLTRNALWLNLTENYYGKASRKFDRKYVLVEGTFSAKNRGHMSLFSGAIEDIKRFQPWIQEKERP